MHLDDWPDASDSTTRERVKARALWPRWLCVAVALDSRLALVCVCVFLHVVFMELCVFLLVTLVVLDGVMGASLVCIGVLDEKRNTVAGITPSGIDITFSNNTLRATPSRNSTFFKKPLSSH